MKMKTHKWLSCRRKVRYGHKETAQRACSAMFERGNLGLSEYKCEHCDGWHIGHKRTDLSWTVSIEFEKPRIIERTKMWIKDANGDLVKVEQQGFIRGMQRRKLKKSCRMENIAEFGAWLRDRSWIRKFW